MPFLFTRLSLSKTVYFIPVLFFMASAYGKPGIAPRDCIDEYTAPKNVVPIDWKAIEFAVTQNEYCIESNLNVNDNGPRLIRIQGIRFVVKINENDPNHLRNEYETNRAYKSMGISVPDQIIIKAKSETEPAINTESESILISEWIEGMTQVLA